MAIEYNEEDLDVIKDKLREALKVDEEDDDPLVVMALVELAVELAVEQQGGAVEGLSMFLSACSGAPIHAQEAENAGLYVN